MDANFIVSLIPGSWVYFQQILYTCMPIDKAYEKCFYWRFHSLVTVIHTFSTSFSELEGVKYFSERQTACCLGANNMLPNELHMSSLSTDLQLLMCCPIELLPYHIAYTEHMNSVVSLLSTEQHIQIYKAKPIDQMISIQLLL